MVKNMRLVIEIEDPIHVAQGTKEAASMALEQLGGRIKVISVTEDKQEQMRIGER